MDTQIINKTNWACLQALKKCLGVKIIHAVAMIFKIEAGLYCLSIQGL
jgi:hypothetical protein